MKFSRVIGKIDSKLVEQAEARLSKMFLELALSYDNRHSGECKIGGDALLFSLLYPMEHICTLNIPTASTSGSRYFWNPKFILKQSHMGLRLVGGHEAWHAIYMHPQRRGGRNPKLWNICVDYIVNFNLMEDLKARGKQAGETFATSLRKYITVPQYVEMIKNPFAPMPGMELPKTNESVIDLPSPDDDRELTVQEKKELERREKVEKYCYADPDLAEDLRSPEKLYDLFFALLPKCPECGRIGIYHLPKKKSDKPDDANKDQHECSDDCKHDHDDHSNDGDQLNQPGNGKKEPGKCGTCGDGVDIFGLFGTIDEHMDTEESQEKLAKRIADAMESARRMAGHIPAGLEREFGKLVAPKVSWKDVIRARLTKARSGHGKNDWTRYRSRPMFGGMLVPKKKSYYASFGCLLDTSGSMSPDDIAFGLSQLQSLDQSAEGTIVSCDSEVYWKQATKIRSATADELSKIKAVGNGGTRFQNFFSEYEKNIGKCDFLIIITDGFLSDMDIAEMVHPGLDVFWVITNEHEFTPPFGKVMQLRG